MTGPVIAGGGTEIVIAGKEALETAGARQQRLGDGVFLIGERLGSLGAESGGSDEHRGEG